MARIDPCWSDATWAFGVKLALSIGRTPPKVYYPGGGGVFRCEACRRFVGWCVGGSDTLCDFCWCRRERRKAMRRKARRANRAGGKGQ
jgi:hypothetical protein